MKKILILLSIFYPVFISAQVNLKYLKGLATSIGYGSLEKKLRDSSYSFSEAKKVNDSSSSCLQNYAFKKTIYETIPYSEQFTAAFKCKEVEFNPIVSIRFLTRNESLFYNIKAKCKEEKNIEFISEGVKGQRVVSRYKDLVYTYAFTNGPDPNGQVYIIDIAFDFSAGFINP